MADSSSSSGSSPGSIMVTGGAGYIGSHAVQRLLRDGHTVVCVDNLARGHRAAVDRLACDSLHFHQADIGDGETIEKLLREHNVSTIMHFAALAYVGESVTDPLKYYRNNAAGALAMLEAADRAGVSRFVFSSTCATYGEPPADMVPIPEHCPQSPISPYGASKLHVEHMLRDLAEAKRRADQPFGYAALRYFNVAGSDRSGLIGEDHDPETHLIPVVLQAAMGQRDGISIFGTDYPTDDGTCIRDYIHVEDLIDAHVTVMHALEPGDERHYNLGIGTGYSVRQIIDAAQRVTGTTLKITEGPRRAGDPPKLYANPAKIKDELGWSASLTDLDETIASAYRWFQKHPNGYDA